MTVPISEKYIQLATRRSAASERPADRNLVIGKDILELLSSAMYLEPLTIFREYVQNAADAIDEARDEGLLGSSDPGRITIDLDVINREIRIRDNGVGLSRENAEAVLTAFGASRKRDGKARGFRGVGRLSGLSYAQNLTFRTKAAGEDTVTEVRWDCRRLKTILRDGGYAGHLGQVVQDVVTVKSVADADLSAHFFEVHIEKPIRIKNDMLLNEEAIHNYLSQVAPLPFDPEFTFGEEIRTRLEAFVAAPHFGIYLNGSSAAMTRPFQSSFLISKGKTDRGTGFQWLEFRDSDGAPRAIGWILEHGYLGAIQGTPAVRGLRARVGDIQVGGDGIFAQVFPEQRFNAWTIGELHILDRTIIPNGRRDDFEQNPAYHSLIGQLAPLGRALAKRCRVSSARRNRYRRFEIQEEHVIQELAVLEQNALRPGAARTLRRDIVARLAEMEKLLGASLVMEAEREDLARRLDKLNAKLVRFEGGINTNDPFAGVSPRRREIYQEVIALIYECSANRLVAKALVDRLTPRLTAS